MPSDSFVLDLGCGSGKLLRDLFQQGVGVDLSPQLIDLAHDKKTDHDYVVADIKHLPFREALFPAVVCIDVFEHVNNTELLLDEVRWVTETNGIVVITAVNLLFWPLLELLEVFHLKLPEGPHKWVHPLSVVTLLNERGFHCSTTNHYFGMMQVIVARRKECVRARSRRARD